MNRRAQEAILSQVPRRLAARIGLTDGAVYAWLHGKAYPRYHHARKLEEALAGLADPPITIDDIMAPHEDLGVPDRRILPRKTTPQPQEI